MCLLALIADTPCYGYEMVQKLQVYGLELVSEGSIYPLLSRLEKAAFIEGYFVPSEIGPPRKYYRILPRGQQALTEWINEWKQFSASVNALLQRQKVGHGSTSGEACDGEDNERTL